jgi:thiamine biosynthesis lipoprotein
MTRSLSRRRLLAVTAAAAGCALTPGAGAAAAPLRTWTGTALGARASLRLRHPDAREAERLFAACRAEIARLERVFSLWRTDSALSRLNAEGALETPPLDLVRLLAEARRVAASTGGAFDPTVQPLWELHARHFAARDADPDGPPASALAEVAARTGWRRIEVSRRRVALGAPGMALTLNGIAQGYITDRVADLLRREGMARVLVDLGEARALGAAEPGRPWRAAIADPDRDGASLGALELEDAALATTSPSGFAFDADGRFPHLIDPRTGRPGARHASVSVVAPRASEADALSTGFAQMSLDAIASTLRDRPGRRALVSDGAGGLRRLGPFPA